MLNGHLDTVGVEGMTHPPFTARVQDGRLFGRGSADMKSGVAAMCVAAREAVERGVDGEIIVACVIDEEYDSAGTRALLAGGVRADAAIVTEPTRLAICAAHRGFVWADLTVRGVAAHGSQYDLGVDAITHAALIVAALDQHQRDILTTRHHPLLGRGSLHASTIHGGTGYSTYPDQCTVQIERRTLPGETAASVRAELEAAVDTVRSVYPESDVAIQITAAHDGSDVSPGAPIVRALDGALRAEALPVQIAGMQAWTDCALLNAAAIPAVCFGPGELAMAHSAEEFVAVQEIEQAARVLRHLLLDWCNGTPHSHGT
jgi:acetylornithine deacetylase